MSKGGDEKQPARTFVSYARGRGKVAPLPRPHLVFRRLASLSPFGSIRDFILWLSLVVVLMPTAFYIVSTVLDQASARGAMAGAAIGLICTRILNLRGKAELRDTSPQEITEHLEIMNYRYIGLLDGFRLLKPAGNSWLRWDSNIALVGPHEIEAPLFLMWSLNKRLRSHNV